MNGWLHITSDAQWTLSSSLTSQRRSNSGTTSTVGVRTQIYTPSDLSWPTPWVSVGHTFYIPWRARISAASRPIHNQIIVWSLGLYYVMWSKIYIPVTSGNSHYGIPQCSFWTSQYYAAEYWFLQSNRLVSTFKLKYSRVPSVLRLSILYI